MCQIMEELVEKRAKKELQKGIQKGIQKGRLEGIQEGIQKGRLEGIKFLIAAYRKLGMSDEQIIEQIASEYEISKKEVALYVY